ncbi:hypothetical protein FBZ90_11123 [Nitrospirillum pindoramense]|uniref:Cytochrome c domain-containing protein n=2 Tax=Nitrospirillum amazonense TaxID=28077 RepID=A0A560GYD3_9PROT|nr:hypothetical protein FBZ90_11123 [Nitrospirillum amazonense]
MGGTLGEMRMPDFAKGYPDTEIADLANYALAGCGRMER